jgi:hypothetical protein
MHLIQLWSNDPMPKVYLRAENTAIVVGQASIHDSMSFPIAN